MEFLKLEKSPAHPISQLLRLLLQPMMKMIPVCLSYWRMMTTMMMRGVVTTEIRKPPLRLAEVGGKIEGSLRFATMMSSRQPST